MNKRKSLFYRLMVMGILVLTTRAATADISGKVYQDFNANGQLDSGTSFNEPGASGITVKAYGADGSEAATTTSAADGTYTLSGLTSGANYRVEFTWADSWLKPGAAGGTSVQFAQDGAVGINASVNDPVRYCQNNPSLCTAEMIAGDPQNATAATGSVLKKWGYSLANGTVTPTTLATDNLVGTLWGLAYARGTDKLYSTAFLKRHAGLGPNGLGAIYVTSNPRSGAGVASALFLDVATVPGVSIGTVPSNSARGLAAPTGTASDTAIYDQVGKVGLGGIDVTDDGQMLWTISLNDKKLLAIPASNPVPASVQTYDIPDPGCTAGSGSYRPFAVKYYHDQLYIGVTCDASVSLASADLTATVFRFDPNNPGSGFNSVLTVPLGYTKGPVNTGCTTQQGRRWFPWVNTPYPGFNPACPAGNNKDLPQPMLSDIEFDTDGSMIMGFTDRFAHQSGAGIALPDGTLPGEPMGGGDILRAWNNNGTFVLENNGSVGSLSGGVGNNQGPGGGEFYQGDYVSGYPSQITEDSTGALAFLPGSGEVATTVWDPFTTHADTGIGFLSNTNGTVKRRHLVSTNPQFGKGTGLGDIELLCDNAPLEIGNRVWLDSNGNGIQDADETGISGVQVQLLSGTTEIASATTAADGTYYFSSAAGTSTASEIYGISGLQPGQAYTVKFPTTVGSYHLTSVTAGSNPQIDSNAPTSGEVTVAATDIPEAGANNHSFDVGYTDVVPAATCSSITNTASITGVTETDNNLVDNTASVTIQANCMQPQTDLKLVKTVSPSEVRRGGTVTYTLTLTNESDVDATGVKVTDNLPAGLTVVSSNPSQGTFTGGVWDVGNVAAHATATLTINVTVD